jgi:hypothetical protein
LLPHRLLADLANASLDLLITEVGCRQILTAVALLEISFAWGVEVVGLVFAAAERAKEGVTLWNRKALAF